MSVELIINCTDATSQSPYSFSQSSEDAAVGGGSGKELIINCTSQQSPYVYEQRTDGCVSSIKSFEDNLGGGDSDPIITEDGEYFTLSE